MVNGVDVATGAGSIVVDGCKSPDRLES